MRKNKNFAAAFTLIELLVVVGIIAVLLALLFPSVKGVMEKSHRLRCMSNQRQLGMAMIHSAADHDGMLPFPNWGTSTAYGPGWAYDPAKGITGNLTDLTTGALWPYVRDYRVYRCPKDALTTLPATACKEWKLTSFNCNGAVANYSGGRPNQLSQFRPTDAYLWENAIANFAAGGDLSNFPLDAGQLSMEFRHLNGGCFVCFDAHAEWISSNDYAVAANNTTSRNQFWCKPGSASGH